MFIECENSILFQSVSTRLITFIWWVFSVILLVLYATLVAEEYATARAIPKIQHWRDLLNQDYVEFGCVEGGSTQKFFEVKYAKAKMKRNDFYEGLTSGLIDGLAYKTTSKAIF
jgi:hypothetical protein